MRRLRHAICLLAVTVVMGCYDYDGGPDIRPQRDITQCFDADGKAWLTLSFDLSQPSSPTPATRGTFGDGDEAGHTIKTLTLVLFHGPQTAAEEALTVATTYTIGYASLKHHDSQVTHHSSATIQISRDYLDTGDRLCLLAIANMTPNITTGQTFASVRNMESGSLTTTIDGTDYFVVTNSPTATANDGSGEVGTLVEVSPDDLFPTAEEAEQHPTSEVYLERAAARLTVTQAVSPMAILGNRDISFTDEDLRFALCNYNQQCYLIRHFDQAWLSYNASNRGYRFTEPQVLPSGRYRTYWAQDVNYDGTGRQLTALGNWHLIGESLCLAENTSDVGHMTGEQSTAVIIGLQLNGGNDFYTASTTGSDIIYQLPENSLEEEGTSAHSTFARRLSPTFSQQRSARVSTAKTIDEYLRQWLMQTNSDFRQWVNDYAGGQPRHVHISVETADNGLDRALVTAVTQTARTSGQGIADFNSLQLADYLNHNITLRYYHAGRCFYHVPIRHFDDTLAPWQSPTAATDNSAAQTYGDNANDYLGRYGVVRNNWYMLNISSISHVGSPVTPSGTSTTDADDRVEQLLNTTLTISSWNDQSKDL